jgi:hypothetical protein
MSKSTKQAASNYAAADGTQRGVRHGNFAANVATAEHVLASLPRGTEYTTRQLATEYGLPGYAIRTAAMRAFARDQSVMLARKPTACATQYIISVQ